MKILEVPAKFQPEYNTIYPMYSSGKNMEEFMFEEMKNYENIPSEYIYIPVFWTSYYMLNDYSDKDGELADWLDTLDKSQKYFTVVQYDSGIYVKNENIQLIVFSAGGGGLNTSECIRPVEFHDIIRHVFCGKKGTHDIPLLCLPEFPKENIEKDIFCSFMGRLDTHTCRLEIQETLKDNSKFQMHETTDYDTYKNIINRSLFTLCHRGYGYTSFRLYEAIHANSIPIYIWEDKISLPYAEEIDWNEFSVVLPMHEIHELENILAKIDIKKMQEKLEEIKHLFTFPEIAKYMIRKITLPQKEQKEQKEQKISLAIPHYNNSQFIREAIEPALNDNRVDEIIICDDVSRDIEQLEELIYTLQSPKIKLFKNTENLGAYGNKINTISKCKNEWAILLDSDNILSPQYINILYDITEWNKNTIYGAMIAETFPGEPSQYLNFTEYLNLPLTKELYIERAYTHPRFQCLMNDCNYFVPVKEFLICMESETYDRTKIGAVDALVMLTDWLCKNNKFHVVDKLTYFHRLHPNSISQISTVKWYENDIRRQLVEKVSLCDKFGGI